jgi:endoglucanase
MLRFLTKLLTSGCLAIIIAIGAIHESYASYDAFDFNKRLALGVNLGNMLEAPTEGEWGLKVQPEYLQLIFEAGFKHVRIPVRWSAHALRSAPYTVNIEFLDRIDEVVHMALKNHLMVVLNMHHYEELDANVDAEHKRFIAIWRQIADHFKKLPDEVAFEIYNEPCKSIDENKWNQLMAEALLEIRRTNPERIVVVGPVHWNNVHNLTSLVLPNSDHRLIATIHYYEPFHFTHQGASWAGPESEKWLGTTWTASSDEVKSVAADFDIAAQWATEHERPVYLGEFGAFSKAEMDSRVRWTRAVLDAARKRSFSAAYWEFGSGFGIYNPERKEWRAPLLDALIRR